MNPTLVHDDLGIVAQAGNWSAGQIGDWVGDDVEAQCEPTFPHFSGHLVTKSPEQITKPSQWPASSTHGALVGGFVRVVGAPVVGPGVGAIVGDEDVGENVSSWLQSVAFTISVMKVSRTRSS